MASASHSTARKMLSLRPGTLAAACFLIVTAIALAYVGGVMTGRAYSARQMEKEASTRAAEHSTAVGKAVEDRSPSDTQVILSPAELGFVQALRSSGTHEGTAETAAPAVEAPPAAPPVPVGPQQASAALTASSGTEKAETATLFDYVFQVAAFRDEDSVDALRQRLEGRGLRTRMQREGKLLLVRVLLRGTEASAAEVPVIMEEMRLGKPLLLSRKPVPVP